MEARIILAAMAQLLSQLGGLPVMLGARKGAATSPPLRDSA